MGSLIWIIKTIETFLSIYFYPLSNISACLPRSRSARAWCRASVNWEVTGQASSELSHLSRYLASLEQADSQIDIIDIKFPKFSTKENNMISRC